jgi:TRAP-type mannitol/chloroaromatic compound transport system permease large subunit
MLCLIIVVIMMGFPTAFTLMGLGMAFGFTAFYDPSQPWLDNRVFNLMVQRTYGAMTNDTLLSIPLFVLMGYVMERGALVDKMFHSVQLAFRLIGCGHFGDLHLLGHCQRLGRCGGGSDGRDCHAPHAECRL